MEKKLTAQGPKKRKSYTVTLPINWVKEQGLNKTKLVILNIVGDKVIISSQKEPQERIRINGDEYVDVLIKVFQGLYRQGVNEIKFEFTDNELAEEALNIIEKKLIGYEIIEQKGDYVIIKDITKPSEEDFKVIFRRIFLLLLELSKSRNLTQIKSLDRTTKKLINYCQRILMKKGHSEFKKTPLYYLILDRLEKLVDEFKWVLRITITQKTEPSALKETNALLRKSYELFYNYNSKTYAKHQYQTYKLMKKIKLGTKVDKVTLHTHNLARILNSLYGDIFTLKFNEKIHRT